MSALSYHVIVLVVPSAKARQTALALYTLGALGIEEEVPDERFVRIRAYFVADGSQRALVSSIQAQCPDIEVLQSHTIVLPQARIGAVTFDPFELVPAVWVYPSGTSEAVLPHETLIFLRPGPVFGSGRHPTTRLVAEALVSLAATHPSSLLDVGTGSGILAILAKQLGIAQVAAVEIAPEARENAIENFKTNCVEDIAMYETLDHVQDTFDVVVANVVAPTLLYLKASLCAHLKPNGILVLSGIAAHELSEIESAFCEFKSIKLSSAGEWRCWVGRRSQ